MLMSYDLEAAEAATYHANRLLACRDICRTTGYRFLIVDHSGRPDDTGTDGRRIGFGFHIFGCAKSIAKVRSRTRRGDLRVYMAFGDCFVDPQTLEEVMVVP